MVGVRVNVWVPEFLHAISMIDSLFLLARYTCNLGGSRSNELAGQRAVELTEGKNAHTSPWKSVVDRRSFLIGFQPHNTPDQLLLSYLEAHFANFVLL